MNCHGKKNSVTLFTYFSQKISFSESILNTKGKIVRFKSQYCSNVIKNGSRKSSSRKLQIKQMILINLP